MKEKFLLCYATLKDSKNQKHLTVVRKEIVSTGFLSLMA